MKNLQVRRRGINYRHIARYGEIISVFAKYGFGDLLSRIDIDRHIGRKLPWRKGSVIQVGSRWDRVRLAIEELGPAFVKLGQFMSNRSDILPNGLVASLQRLQDSVPPFPSAEARSAVELELGKPINELFKEFGDVPVASASIAQVHRARLHTGEDVAVKVMRPRIEHTIDLDCDILFHLAALLDRTFAESWGISVAQMAHEFERGIRKELDFAIEASHIRHFEQNFKGDPTIHVPAVYRSHSSRRVMVTEFINAVKVSDTAGLDRAGLDRTLIAQRGARLILKQVFEHGFFHGDPHPGNILIMPDNVICFLDFGMTGVISQSQREHMAAVMVGIANKDAHRVVRALLQLSRQPAEDVAELEYEITELIEEYSGLSLKDVNVGEVLNRALRLIATHKLKVIPGFYLLLKSLVTIEGVGFSLDPGFDMVKEIGPFAKDMVGRRMRPDRILNEAWLTSMDILNMLRQLPVEAGEILEQIKGGRLRIEFEHKGLEPMLAKSDQLVSRIVFAVVLGSLVIGSSVMTHANLPPKLYGVPIIGIAGFLVAGVLGFWLVVSILRSGKM